jgi:hypothetical protein
VEQPALHGVFFFGSPASGRPASGLSAEFGDPIDLPLDVLDQQEINEAGDVVLFLPPARTPRDHQVDPVGPLHRSEHDFARAFLEDPSEDGSLFRIEVNHARGVVGGSRSLPITQPASAARKARRLY